MTTEADIAVTTPDQKPDQPAPAEASPPPVVARRKPGRPKKLPGEPKSHYGRRRRLRPIEIPLIKKGVEVAPPSTEDEALIAATALEREKQALKAVSMIMADKSVSIVRDVVAFLLKTADGHYWSKASAEVGLSWSFWHNLMNKYPRLKSMYIEAQLCGEMWRAENLRALTYERASEGWKEPVYHRGVVVGHIQRFSDRLAELFLKALDPTHFNAGTDTAANQVQVVIFNKPT